ncbi:hypothetical protein GCM10020358_29890 [Amorphoplanes nipponensis]|uniref:TIM-barrel domain-containing protein n=1 Tax=Actinoplanes nipponensis TaxID=135950 RepID=UPI0031E5A103
MKFTDGYWRKRDGLTVLHPVQLQDTAADARSLTAYASAKRVHGRGDTLDAPIITVTLSAPRPDVIRVSISHFAGAVPRTPDFEILADPDFRPEVGEHELVSGSLTARFAAGDAWGLEFLADGRRLTRSGGKGMGVVDTADGAHYVHEQLDLGVGEAVYGLGERFGPLVKNGQTVDIWNEDGGTSSEQAYKNVPFYLTNRGYGVLVDHPGRVSFEVGSELVGRTQFSVAGQSLSYLVIHGPTPADVLRKYTALTGRPALPPAWSFGLWLTTSFTTSYDEETVTGFVDGMAERDLPLSVFHFDTFWMRECQLVRLRVGRADLSGPARHSSSGWPRPGAAHLRVDQPVHRAALAAVRRGHGGRLPGPPGRRRRVAVGPLGRPAWPWSTSPTRTPHLVRRQTARPAGDGCGRLQVRLRRAHPASTWSGTTGSDPERMHNYYTQLYNRVVFDVLREHRGEGDAVVFARSATVGGQQFPVHWGGDNSSTYESMAESLRGGLSLAHGVRVRLSGARHRRLRGAAGPGGVSSAGSQFGLAVLVTCRLHGNQTVPGAVAVRRGGGRRAALVHPAQAHADAVHCSPRPAARTARACR